MIFNKKRPKIGLALGAGGAKGYAHIGVIKALEQAGIPIDYIAGSSIGSLIGGLYAATKDIESIEALAHSTNRSKVTSILFDPCFDQGFFKGTKFHEFIKNHIGDIEFKDLHIPFTAVSTDLYTGNPELMKKGTVSEAIKASCAIPLVFKPLKIGNKLLTDGFVSMPVPVQAVKAMGADIVIAVNLSQEYFDEDLAATLGIKNVFMNTYAIMAHHLAEAHVKHADIHISPPLKHFGWKLLLNKQEKMKAIELGHEYMSQQISQLQLLIEERRRSPFSKAFASVKEIPQQFQQKRTFLNGYFQNLKALSFLPASSRFDL